mgnify:CR=1 FL=1|jgi:uncharacterized membrane protein YfcA|tara:strand:- start:2737 stop:3123 length:387 start_codon:yes stop_codon:yes gene_type:complete
MNIITIILSIFIGFIGGFIGSGVGSAGGTLMVALLIIFNVIPVLKTAMGTVLLAIIPPVSAGAIMAYWKTGHVKWKFAVLLMVANFIGATMGAKIIVKQVSTRSLELFYASFLLLLSIYFYYKAYANK